MSSSSERAPPGCYWTALPRRPGAVCGRTGARRKKVRNWTVRPFSDLFHPHFINRIRPLKKSPELVSFIFESLLEISSRAFCPIMFFLSAHGRSFGEVSQLLYSTAPTTPTNQFSSTSEHRQFHLTTTTTTHSPTLNHSHHHPSQLQGRREQSHTGIASRPVRGLFKGQVQ